MKYIKTLFSLLIFFIITNSCKYEEGPILSIRTAKNRLCDKTWQMEKYIKNGVDISDSLKEDAFNVFIRFFDEGNFEQSYFTDSAFQVGTWSFINKKR